MLINVGSQISRGLEILRFFYCSHFLVPELNIYIDIERENWYNLLLSQLHYAAFTLQKNFFLTKITELFCSRLSSQTHCFLPHDKLIVVMALAV